MENAKEFEGKTLDEAISQACAFFDTPREKLEIDIVQDAKSGIFGLVGARKAIIRARVASLSTRVSDILAHPQQSRLPRKPARPQVAPPEPEGSPSGKEERSFSEEASRQERRRPAQRPARDVSVPETGPFSDRSERGRDPRRRDNRNGYDRPAPRYENDGNFPDDLEIPQHRIAYTPLEALDQNLLLATVRNTAERLIGPIAGNANLEVKVGGGRVAVHIRSNEDLGLLIGREGQTLACLQYLASRIVARQMGTPVRLQFDAGDYRERQDEKLRELAYTLADRAKATGRVCPTRPLSSYQRRIVHMALQDDPTVQTRSAGEGPLKRVVIQRARVE